MRFQRHRRNRAGAQPRERNGLAGHLTIAIFALLDAAHSGVDLGDQFALTVAGALTPAGLGGCIISLMERGLIEQVTGTVRWRESIAFMASAGVNVFYEVGSGKVLSGLVKRIADGATGVSIGTPDRFASCPMPMVVMAFLRCGQV